MKISLFLKNIILIILLFLFVDFVLAEILRNGLNKFYGFDKTPSILINGSSMSISAFNIKDIENNTKKKVALFAREGVSINDRFSMLKYYFSEYPNTTKTVIYEVNPTLLSEITTSDNVYTLFYPFMDNKNIDEFIKKQAPPKEYYINKYIKCKRFDLQLLNLVIKGYMHNYSNFKTHELDPHSLSLLKSQKGKIKVGLNESKIKLFEQTTKLIWDNNSDIILVMMPIYYIKNQTFDTISYNSFYNYFKTYTRDHKNVIFIDLNKEDLTTNSTFFSDPIHLNINGQKSITKEIIGILNTF